MIYFLVNNNFHLIDVEHHLKDLKEFKTGLIKIPHNLTLTTEKKFDFQIEFKKPISNLKDHFKIYKFYKTHQKIKNKFKDIKPTDTLVIYTEYEYLNHYIIKIFKKINAKVILIEEGFPTYLTFSILPDSKLPLKKIILSWYLKNILRYNTSNIKSINKIQNTQVNDNQIDLILLYNNINIKRKIKSGVLHTSNKIYDNLNENKIIFLNEGIYWYYVNIEEYKKIINDILDNLSNNFENVYFKFHPREKEIEKNITRNIIKNYSNIQIIEENSPVELMISKIGAKYIASFLSQTNLYISNSNCISIYLFHLYPEIMKNIAFQSVKNVIDEMNYSFLNDWSEIKNEKIGFTKIKEEANSLLYYIESLK